MRKVAKGEIGVVVTPSHVKTLVTKELLDAEIKRVLVSDVEVAKRTDAVDLVVHAEDYINYLEKCKDALVVPKHPDHEDVESAPAVPEIYRYKEALKGMYQRIQELEATQVPFYSGDEMDVGVLFSDYFGDYNPEEVIEMFMLRGLFGDEIAKQRVLNEQGDERGQDLIDRMNRLLEV